MLHHHYAPKYARHLRRFHEKSQTLRDGHAQPTLTLVEVGILRGTGLAIWCDLFPEARIIGLDIDLGHFRSNIPFLKRRGAFTLNEPEVHEFDQLADNEEFLEQVLSGDRVNICIDDGLHTIESILTTLDSIYPYLADDFVYFIEDNRAAYTRLEGRYSDINLLRAGQLTVLTRALNVR